MPGWLPERICRSVFIFYIQVMPSYGWHDLYTLLDLTLVSGKCLNDYKSNPAYIIRRLDPFENIKHQCDKCSGSGYDYIIYDRSSVRR